MQQQHSDDDSDEDLSGINFPIIDNSSTTKDQSTTKISYKDDVKKSNGYNTSNNQITNNKKGVVDEDAIIRCFNISVNSHMNKSDTVEVFEPMPPKKEVSKTTLSKADQPTKKQKVEQ